MGADGGSIPRRDELCKTKHMRRAEETREQEEARVRARWTLCALTLAPLHTPVTVDKALGFMFNKDALIQALLAHELPRHLKHIRSLKKDTIDAKLYTSRVCLNPSHASISLSLTVLLCLLNRMAALSCWKALLTCQLCAL